MDEKYKVDTIQKLRKCVRSSGDSGFFWLSYSCSRAILPIPAERAANDRRQPVNDLMTMSTDGSSNKN